MTSALPAKPSLDQLKKQAKDLLAAHGDRSPSCLAVLRHLHRFKDTTDQAVFAASLQLADAQFALAIEYGFTTWEKLVQHLESRSLGLGEKAAHAWARVRDHAGLAKLIGGVPKSVKDASWGDFIYLDIEGPQARFLVEEAELGDWRLLKQQRVGDFLNTFGVQAPRITLLEVDGRSISVNQALEGVPVGQVHLSPAEQERYVSDLSGLLARLHAVPFADACRILGLPDMTPEEAAKQFRYGGYLEVDVIENKLAGELAADQELNEVWRETRAWIGTFESTPADLVFGHGDLWESSPLVTKTPDGYRLTGIHGLYNAGFVNLYDEFLRVASLGYFCKDEVAEPARSVVAAYRQLPGTRRVEDVPLRHAITAFWFYLAHETTGENRMKWLANGKRTQGR